MDVILRMIDNYSFIFLLLLLSIYYLSIIYFYCLYTVALSYINEKILCTPRIFDIKEARNVDKATSKYFFSNLQAFFFIVTGKFVLYKDFIYSVAYSTVKRIIS